MSRKIFQSPATTVLWIALLVLGIVVPIAAVLRFGSDDPSEPGTQAAAATTSADAEDEPVLAIYGDGAAGDRADGLKSWPFFLGRTLGARADVHAAAGAGYVGVSSSQPGTTFLTLVEENPEPAADVVVISSSRSDIGLDGTELDERSRAVFRAVRSAHPDTPMVVIGPTWNEYAVPGTVLRARDTVESNALAAGATFVDPIAEGWFFNRPDVIAPNGTPETDHSHRYLASLIQPHVVTALAAVPERR